MKNTFKKMHQIALLAIPLMMSLSSCKKDEVEPQAVTTVAPQKTEIETLTVYFAKLINVKPTDIQYNDTTEQFSLWGVEQLTKDQLTRMYENSKKASL
jgi:hypothetical protein